MQHNTRKVIGVFTLMMINVAAIQSLRNLPMMAGVGWSSIFFYIVAAFTFFIPTALVSAELATGWPSTGGVYTWVKEAFGPRWGFAAIWLQWTENIIWYPTVLSFTAATIAYLFNPALADNKLYILSMVMATYWGCTLIDLLGMKISGMISTIGVIIGTLIPGVFIITLGLFWLLSGHTSEIPFTTESLYPDLSSIHNIVFLVGVMLGFAGMEMSAVHAREVKHPQKDYPRAIFYSTGIILTVSILGSLAIAVVVPSHEISLVAGIMQAFSAFFNAYEMPWMTPILAGLISLGAISMVSTWIVGPSKGLFQTAHEGHLPPLFHKRNKQGMPIAIMIIQGVIVSLLCSAFLLMPTVSSSYWVLNDLTALLYLIMYILLFLTAIRLRYSHPHIKRAYRVPGGKTWGMWMVAGTGLIASITSFITGFFPPAQLDTGTLVYFELFLGSAVIILFGIPFLIYNYQKAHWKIKRD